MSKKVLCISRDAVVTRLKYDRIFIAEFITDLLLNFIGFLLIV